MKHPKEVIFDIETTNLEADMGIILTFAYKLRGDKAKPKSFSIHDFPLFKKEPWNDAEIVKAAYGVLKDADSLIFHYGDDFDLPFIKTRLLEQGLYFPKCHTVDTCKVIWKNLKLRARMANAAEFFGAKPKMNVPKRVWKKAGFGHVPSLEVLRKRCIADVVTTEQFSEKLAPYIKFINRNLFYDDKGCPNCGSKRIQADGKRYFATTANIRQTYECQECKTVFQGEVISSAGPYRHT